MIQGQGHWLRSRSFGEKHKMLINFVRISGLLRYIFLYFIFHFKTYIQTVFIRLKPETAYVLDFGYLLFRVDDGIIL